MPQSIFYNSQLLRFTISILDHRNDIKRHVTLKMSCLSNACGGGTGPLSCRPLKLGPGHASPRAQRSAQARYAPPGQARKLPGRAVLRPGQNVVPWAGLSCLKLHGFLYLYPSCTTSEMKSYLLLFHIFELISIVEKKSCENI